MILKNTKSFFFKKRNSKNIMKSSLEASKKSISSSILKSVEPPFRIPALMIPVKWEVFAQPVLSKSG
jgi:hypothetical protein